ncbi:type IVB secretion system protein IcmW [Pseudoalteromonas nigrifaciens]|uniref:type IVB secretion system protein IcmW n=1 Tax=Pseudoalteromonas nigrifaciens TaxID=28109 RepID=UPI003FD34B27
MTIPIDIAVENVHKFSNEIPGVKLIFADMEKVESWVARKGKDEGFTSELREKLHGLTEGEITRISSKVNPLLWVLFYLPSSTSFFLLYSINDVVPKISDRLLEESLRIMGDDSETDKRHAQIFIDRCTHLNAANFIANIVNESFSQALIQAINDTKLEVGDAT